MYFKDIWINMNVIYIRIFTTLRYTEKPSYCRRRDKYRILYAYLYTKYEFKINKQFRVFVSSIICSIGFANMNTAKQM